MLSYHVLLYKTLFCTLFLSVTPNSDLPLISMKSLLLISFALLLLVSSSLAGCDDDIIRGVNLGGWLLLEPWITPIFFEAVNVGELQDKIVDEWTYAELLDPFVYKTRMQGHWSTFVTKSHFEELVQAGISHVRIPVGYWYWDVEEGEPFPAPNLDDTDPASPLFYLKRGLQWCDELGLQVRGSTKIL